MVSRLHQITVCLPLAIGIVLVVGCKRAQPEPSPAPSASAAIEATPPVASSASVPAPRFSKTFGGSPCSLLSPAQLADVVHVDPATIKTQELGRLCFLRWKGGTVNVGFVTVSESKESAREHFERAYTNTDDRKFESVPNLGDAAQFETTVHTVKKAGKETASYTNKMAVLVDNMSFAVTFMRGDASKQAKAETIALAQAVINEL